jgi:hypothetical protein
MWMIATNKISSTPDYTRRQGPTGPTGVVENEKTPEKPGFFVSFCFERAMS